MADIVFWGLILGVVSFFMYRLISQTLALERSKALASHERGKLAVQAIKEFNTLCHQQHGIWSELQNPSKNALHSKYKKDLVGQYYEIEKNKLSVVMRLRELTATGFCIKIIDHNGNTVAVPLDQYIETIQQRLSDYPNGHANEPKNTTKISSKNGLRVIENVGTTNTTPSKTRKRTLKVIK